MTLRIKLVSDLHLEFLDINIQNDNNYDVLILAGDIMVAQELHDHPDVLPGILSNMDIAMLGRRQANALLYRNFLKRVSFQFPHVVYVAGNHEFYHGKWQASIDYLRTECATYPNIHFLEKDTVTIQDVTFIGGTLWTDMNKSDPYTLHAVRDMMNDFRLIRNDQKGFTPLKPADTILRHREHLKFIKHVVAEKPDEKFVVVGHHCPSHLSIHEIYKNESIMNGAFTSDLSEFIIDRPQIKLWVHGHTHHTFDYVIGGTRIVCNPRGYESYGEESGWNPQILLEI